MAGKNSKELDVIASGRGHSNKEASNSEKYEEYQDEYEDYTVDIEDIYQEEKEEKKKNRIKKKKKRRRKIALLIAELFAITILGFTLFMLIMPNSKAWFLSTPVGKFLIGWFISEEDANNIIDKDFDRGNVDINTGLDTSAMEGYYNIVLLGLDSREGELESGVNSDTIIIASINENTGEVKLCSVYRDTYLRVAQKDGSYEYNKVNSAYLTGSAQATVKTLNANFDLNISDYVSINFSGLANIIDMLGGIDINISETEMYWINQYLGETRIVTGIDSPLVYSYGQVHLNGIQTVAFCRIRKTPFTDEDGTVYGDDFGRTARQRRVIMKLVELAKNAGVNQVMDIANEIFNSNGEIIYTSIPYDEIIDLIPTLLNFSIVDSHGYPYTYETPVKVNLADGSKVDYPVVISGLTYNNYKLHEFLFNDKNYKPSETVKNIESVLESMLGYGEKRLEEDENLVLK